MKERTNEQISEWVSEWVSEYGGVIFVMLIVVGVANLITWPAGRVAPYLIINMCEM